MSRYASSMEAISTSGEKEVRISRTFCEKSR